MKSWSSRESRAAWRLAVVGGLPRRPGGAFFASGAAFLAFLAFLASAGVSGASGGAAGDERSRTCDVPVMARAFVSRARASHALGEAQDAVDDVEEALLERARFAVDEVVFHVRRDAGRRVRAAARDAQRDRRRWSRVEGRGGRQKGDEGAEKSHRCHNLKRRGWRGDDVDDNIDNVATLKPPKRRLEPSASDIVT